MAEKEICTYTDIIGFGVKRKGLWWYDRLNIEIRTS